MQARSNGYKKICVCVGGWGLEGGGDFDKQTKVVCVGGGGSVVSYKFLNSVKKKYVWGAFVQTFYIIL